MAEIIKTYKQSVPAMRFIGKKYFDSDRVDGGFGKQWNDWFTNNWISALEQLSGNLSDEYEDAGSFIGLMRHKDGEPFEYWIGMFLPIGTDVPDGYLSVDFTESNFGICWLYGVDLYMNEPKCAEKLGQDGYKVVNDKNGAIWFFERYACPRFTTPDEKGNRILDIGFFIE